MWKVDVFVTSSMYPSVMWNAFGNVELNPQVKYSFWKMPCCNTVPKKPNPRNPLGFGMHSCCAQISLRSQTMASVNVAVDITLKAASTKIPQF